MLERIRGFFEERIAPLVGDAPEADREHAFQLATAALMMEITRADHQIDDAEREAVGHAIRQAFELDEAETAELVHLAEEEAAEATSLYQFTSLVNERFPPEEKAHVMELLWQVAYSDGSLDKFEEHIVRRIADLIHVPHRVFIATKLKVADDRDRG